MKNAGLIIVFLILAFAVGGFLLPTRIYVERHITVERPANMMFAILNSYHYFSQWSPWTRRDPQAEFVISGPGAGVGARMSWKGEPQLLGSGWQEIVVSKPFEQIDIKLLFDSQAVAYSSLKLQQLGDVTSIIWSFDSYVTAGLEFPGSFLARFSGLFFDSWVGSDYEQGLTNLKQFAESLPVSDFSETDIGRVNVQAQNILFVTSGSSQDPTDITTAMAAAYLQISEFMSNANIQMSGQPMAITRAWEEGGYQFDAAIPVDEPAGSLPAGIKTGVSPSGVAIRAVHHGPHDQMMPTYEKLAAYMAAHGLNQGTVSWEHYISDPANTEPGEMITHVYIMLEEQETL